MKKLEKIVNLLLKIVELLPILIEFLKALDNDTNVIKSKLESLDIQIEGIKQVAEAKQHQVLEEQVSEAKQLHN